ncbi:hypothetical protein A3B57_01600 [Microgenomates group bacterium RIFCSPLOWO2_01_FULL_47_10]|nr:MAG: hypothetical protein A3B57_01600 [Microgenomates group bacterium RIFCSPLOWO2_01_FULL_47_10]
MAGKKTRKQKIRTAQKKQLFGVRDIPKSRSSHAIDFGYNPGLIRKDLLKTLLVCLLILGVELAAYWYL